MDLAVLGSAISSSFSGKNVLRRIYSNRSRASHRGNSLLAMARRCKAIQTDRPRAVFISEKFNFSIWNVRNPRKP
jgi:hypothetical protein